MEQKDLKETMDQIHIQDEMQEDIIRNLYRPVKRNFFKKTGVLAAATLTAVIVIAVPVQAAIRHLIQERMDNLPAKEVEHLSQMQGSQEISADGFSRDYSPSEKKRMGELFKEYQNGNFPEGEILRVDSKDQVEENVFCYVEETGCFYFPDRELTDEELLEVIDFNYKREYALVQNPEIQKELAGREKEQQKQQALLLQEGGISLQQAIENAEKWMDKLFDLSVDGMEQNAYLDDKADGMQQYCVNYSIQSQCYYYFYISGADGRLVKADSSLAADLDKEGMEEISAKKQLEENYKLAGGILEKIGIHDTFMDITCYYTVKDGKVIGSNLAYYFLKEDGNGYRLDFCCDGNYFRSYRETTLAEYEQKSSQEYVAERIEGAQVRTVSLKE
ncbi:hypothetical protein, partial [Parablautia intestinalis]|uniref:hypothetical protein n=1 Tax=Parablautia intestinalis TaxID=2320100 RepID=UPI00259CF815